MERFAALFKTALSKKKKKRVKFVHLDSNILNFPRSQCPPRNYHQWLPNCLITPMYVSSHSRSTQRTVNKREKLFLHSYTTQTSSDTNAPMTVSMRAIISCEDVSQNDTFDARKWCEFKRQQKHLDIQLHYERVWEVCEQVQRSYSEYRVVSTWTGLHDICM